ncbi:MAG: superoxide dismutase family protein, partial [Oscillospiraceae bacterium]|nr:superoxide dismutase family protein [Oscillospiraceae bacterium]
MQRKPSAIAYIKGSESAPKISGTVSFFQTFSGVFITVDICGLPEIMEICSQHIFAMHIHNGSECT